MQAASCVVRKSHVVRRGPPNHYPETKTKKNEDMNTKGG